jgi:hypothetical protein
MIKPSPNPPAPESEENTGTPHRPCPIFTIRPGINSETSWSTLMKLSLQPM